MSPARAYLMVFIGVCGHASSEFFAVLSGVAGPEASVWRFVLGGAGLVIFALAMPKTRGLWTPLREDWRALIPLSLFGISGGYLLFHLSLDYATIIQVGTVVTTIPIFVGLTNLIVNRSPIGAAKMVSGLAAVAGVALFLTDGYIARLAGDERSLYGVVLALVCAALVSAHAVMVKPYIDKHGAISTITVSIVIGAVGLWVAVAVVWGIRVNPFTLFDKPLIAATSLLILGIWNTTITQLLWLGGLAAVPDITRGSYLFFLKPAITAFLGLVILTQPITPVQIAAIVIICGSVLVEMNWPRLTAMFKRD